MQPASPWIQYRFGDSGAPWELVKKLEVSAEHIALKALSLLAIKKHKEAAAALTTV